MSKGHVAAALVCGILTNCSKSTLTLSESVHPKYSAGQVWTYHARPTEPDSRLTVLRIDKSSSGEIIVHVALGGLSIRSSASKDGVAREISHMPFAEAAIERSVVALERTGPVPAFQEGYASWRTSFDSNQGGFWTVDVAEAVAAMDATLAQ